MRKNYQKIYSWLKRPGTRSYFPSWWTGLLTTSFSKILLKTAKIFTDQFSLATDLSPTFLNTGNIDEFQQPGK